MNPDEERYCYYWYHHMFLSDKARDMINEIIINHDYKAFLCIKEILEGGERARKWKDTYLPPFVYDSESDDPLDLTEETFNLIQYAECECG